MKKAFLLLLLLLWTALCFDTLAQNWSFSCPGGNCLKAGVEAAGNTIGKSSGIITGKGIVRAVQDLIIYFLSFISLIAVIYIMWAGAQMLLFPSSEESSEKTKKIIISVIVGIVIIWFAWWIVSTLFYVLNGRDVLTQRWVPRAVAETQIRSVDFTTYSNKIRALKSRIMAGYSPEVTRDLNVLIDGAYDHLPDRADKYVNKQLYDKVKKAIADYDLHREEIDRGILENAIDAFLEQAQVFMIQGTISATPHDGDAPLSVTLEGKNIIDGSGTTIPEGNFTWWLRTPEGPRVLGRGKTINYIFEEEGTFTVYLTVNSASKNNRGFVDVISFEDQVTVEVGQAKLKLAIFFNDQLATDTVKIPTRESTQKILIDATQTQFASGYTITRTEWDFGNGKTVIREWSPIVEAQNYTEGEHRVKITLTRNDGEIFTRTVLLKIGDPIASISVSNKAPNKGDNVVFQAKKVNQEGVQYTWEIRRFGAEQAMYSTTGPRMEYTFREVGRYSIGLTSSKGETRDKETLEINIESRPPVVRFEAEQLWPETPNIYLLDGTSTYDPDYPDDQSLKYQWFINDKPTQLVNTNSNNSRGEYAFPELGTYQVELHVTDDQGKTASFKKTVTIRSLLSIQINIRPQVVQRGERVTFSATAPNVEIYEWTVGSRDIAVTRTGRYTSTFDVSGTYPLTLKVTDRNGNTNSLQRKIYVVDGDTPFSIVQMSTKSLFTEMQPTACNGQEALIVDRVTPVSLVGDKSVNVGGKTTDLTYFWKIGLNASSTQKNFSHTFDELGCEEISLTVTDKKTWASHTTKEWVKVVNIPPRFSDITVVVENVDMDPMRINLRMEGARDPDGVIRSYTWYYYTSTDEQPQGFRITTKPETSFTLPKINGRYYFSVVLEDANGLRVDTRDISENRFSTPDLLVNQNIATPIIDFRASTTDAKYGDPVELTVTAKNALGQDITKAVEYRWDVDGDGFYDLKTTENFITYKYTVPGEYHPKVKATHRGLSTTKFLTITVTNRLIPQMQVQVIGDKIIAYNTSTGIIQSATWFADDTKVSENKEYLVYTPSGSFPKNIRLEISDGQDKQSVTVPVERSPQNKVLIRKVARPLIILTNENASVTAAPDSIAWTDPTRPLFFYLGESEGEIQYYVIDNDVDIDTDLSGGKNDDADNKGTASYRLGRPYFVPVGTKRVTIMRFRILGADGKEIDSRQIRVTREFMAQEVNADIPNAPTPTTQSFNLSKEDKARLDRLSTLVKNITDEAVKKDLMRSIDQLGDIWYDRADRAETLLQLAHAVDTSPSIPPDLKSRILEQINLIYTQGQEDVEEKDLARTVINDLLAKSTYRKEIFGDGTPENPGLLDQMIDNPEYHAQNKKLAERIYNEYVKIDPSLSDETKSIIQEKLNFLAGTPPVEQPKTPEEPKTGEDGTGFLSNLKGKLGAMGSILLWIAVAIAGLLGMMFAWKKIAGAKRTDDAHGLEAHDISHVSSNTDVSGAEVHPDGSLSVDENAPDWLKSAESPFGSEDILSKEVSESAQASAAHTPDWMHDHGETPTIESNTAPAPVPAPAPAPAPVPPAPEPTPITSTPSETHDIPDWLKEDTHGSPSPEASVTATTTPPEAEPTPDRAKNTPEPVPTEVHDDVPDWLKGAETDTPRVLESSPETTAIRKEDQEKTTNLPPHELFTAAPVPTSETAGETGTTAAIPTPMQADHDDLPDWLKGADTLPETPAETVPETSPEKNPGTDAWNILREEDTLGKPAETAQAAPEPLTPPAAMDDKQSAPAKKKKWSENKHWKGDKAPTKASTKAPAKPKKAKGETATKLLAEGDHLLGPAEDLLESPDHLISPDKDTPSS